MKNKLFPKVQFSFSKYFPWSILILTFIIYIPSLFNKFLAWDDILFITNNPNVKSLTLENIISFFTEPANKAYIPLPMFSWLLQYQIWGDKPLPFIIINILLHLTSTYLVFLIIFQWTKKKNMALLGMLIFGIHTIHVESVIWISERKDMLYSLFFLLSVWHYNKLFNEEKPQTARWKHKNYLYVFIFFILSLFSKVQAVTLPIVLVLIDYYTYKRLQWKLLIEKLPFFLLAFIVGMMALDFQNTFFKHFESVYNFSFFDKIFLSSYALIQYILKILLPLKLSAAYPLPPSGIALPDFYKIYFIAAICFIIFLIFVLWKRKSYGFGLAFFFINIIFMLDYSSVGYFIMADHYVYVASLGIILLIVQFFDYLFSKEVIWKNISLVLILLFIAYLSIYTINRCKVWKDDLTLFTDAVKKYPDNPIALCNIGTAYYSQKDYVKASDNFKKALDIKSDEYKALCNIGVIEMNVYKHFSEAITYFSKAIAINPCYGKALYNRGVAKYSVADYMGAVSDLSEAVSCEPQLTEVYYYRGISYLKLEKYKESVSDFTKAFQFEPNRLEIISWRAKAYYEMNDYNNTLIDFFRLVSKKNDLATNYTNIAYIYMKLQDVKNAEKYINKALFENPNYTLALNERGYINLKTGEYHKAIIDFTNAIKLDSNYAYAYNNRGEAKMYIDDLKGASVDIEKSIKINPNNGYAYLNRAKLKIKIKKTDACNDLRTALNIGVAEAEKLILHYCK